MARRELAREDRKRLRLPVTALVLACAALLLAPGVASAAPTVSFSVSPSAPQQASTQLTFTPSVSDVGAASYSYDWSWGDGSADTTGSTVGTVDPTTLPAENHTYANPGTYTVTLTVTDDLNAVGTATQSVTVLPPPPVASFVVKPSTSEPVDTALTFDDTASTGTNVSSYAWNWGDGTTETDSSPSSTTTHSYSTPGTYAVTLTVTDAFGQANTTKQTVSATSQAPVAAFTISPSTTQEVDTAFNFDGSTSSVDPHATISSYDWNWGDGTSDGTGATPSHSYTTPGSYNVTLTVTDSFGKTSSVTHTVTATSQTPVAAFTISPSSTQEVDTAFNFDGTGSGHDPNTTTSSYSWNFGDGGTSTSPTPSHSYTTPGKYNVTLTVTDGFGKTNSVTHTVTATSQAPVAAFTFSPSTPQQVGTTLTFTSTSTSDSNATPISYDWTWGDGTGDGSGTTPTHSYATPGNYNVTLTVTDNFGKTSSVTHTLTATSQAPIAAFTISPATSQPTNTAFGFDGRGSTPGPNATIASYNWNWGDNTTDGNGATPTHSYSSPGNYDVTLTVTDSLGKFDRITHTVTASGPPAASFTTSPATVPTSAAVTFDGSGSSEPFGTITSYSWDFGDGGTSGLPSPAHAYATAGTYNVSLVVTDAYGRTAHASGPVTVTDRPPTAAFNPSSATVLTLTTINFDGTQSSDPDGTVTRYSWNFGDGGSSTSPTPSHSYSTAGTYTVTLTVTDDSGNTGQVAHQITVQQPPGPALLIPPPQLLKSGSASTSSHGVIDLGKRLFCVGFGPSCTATLTATSSAILAHTRHGGRAARAGSAGTSRFTVAANGSVELTLHLNKRAIASLHKHKRLPLKITIVAVRGTQTVTTVLNLTLGLKKKR